MINRSRNPRPRSNAEHLDDEVTHFSSDKSYRQPGVRGSVRSVSYLEEPVVLCICSHSPHFYGSDAKPSII